MNVRFDHEKLNVYQASLKFVSCASTRVSLNIAEGNGKFAVKDRCRFLDFARGSALECAAYLHVLVAKQLCDEVAIRSGKQQLLEVVSMLMGLISSLASHIAEEQGTYSLPPEQE